MIKLNLEVKKNWLCYQVIEQDECFKSIGFLNLNFKGKEILRTHWLELKEAHIYRNKAPGIPKIWLADEDGEYYDRIYIRGECPQFDNLKFHREFMNCKCAEAFKHKIINAFCEMKKLFFSDSKYDYFDNVYCF